MKCRNTHWLAGLLGLLACGANPSPQYVARVGQKEISAAEFAQRAQKLLMTGYRDLDTLDQAAKLKLLDGMIAQEVLIAAGLERGLDRDSIIAGEVRQAEQKALIEKLYEREALQGDYTSTEEELRRFFVEGQYDVEVLSQQLVCASEAEAQEALRALQGGASFASLVPEYSTEPVQRRFGAQGDIGWYKIADLLEPLKAPMLQMPVGQLYPQPISSPLGYHVFKLNGRRPVEFAAVRELLDKVLHQQKILRAEGQYVGELRGRYELKAHGEALIRLLALPPDQKEWPGEDGALFTWKGGQLTLKEYLEIHRQGRANHPASLDSAALHKQADNLAGQRIMMAEARRLGLDRDPQVRARIEGRRNELVVEMLFNREGRGREPIGEAEERRYYEEHLEQFTRADGKITEFERVRQGIHQLLHQQAQNRVMDRLIAGLREKYKDRIEIRPELLEKAVIQRP